MKFIIDRLEWYRGKGSGASLLLDNSTDLKCCLGFFALACGIPKDSIAGEPTPARVFTHKQQDNQFFYELTENPDPDDDLPEDNARCRELMNINDDPSLLVEVRENLIRNKFAELGHEVEFIN